MPGFLIDGHIWYPVPHIFLRPSVHAQAAVYTRSFPDLGWCDNYRIRHTCIINHKRVPGDSVIKKQPGTCLPLLYQGCLPWADYTNTVFPQNLATVRFYFKAFDAATIGGWVDFEGSVYIEIYMHECTQLPRTTSSRLASSSSELAKPSASLLLVIILWKSKLDVSESLPASSLSSASSTSIVLENLTAISSSQPQKRTRVHAVLIWACALQCRHEPCVLVV